MISSIESRTISTSEQVRQRVSEDTVFLLSSVVKLVTVAYMLLITPISGFGLLSINQESVFMLVGLLVATELLISVYHARTFKSVCDIVEVDYFKEYKTNFEWYAKLGIPVGLLFAVSVAVTGVGVASNTLVLVALYIVLWSVADPLQQSVTARYSAAVESVETVE